MKRRLLIPLLLAALLGALAPLSAEEALTLAKARVLALAQSRTLQQALLAADAALLDEKMLSFTWLPSLAASASGSAGVSTTSATVGLDASVGLRVSQTVFDGAAFVLAAIDKLSTSIARTEARAEYFSVLDTADAAFYAAEEAAASVDSARSDLDNALASQALAKAKWDAGMISSVSYMSQEAAVASKQAALVTAQGGLSISLRTLASLTGQSLPISVEPIDTDHYDALMQRVAALSDAQTEALISRIGQAAEKNNPSLAKARLSSQKAEKGVDLARAEYLPDVSASWNSGLSLTGLTSSLALSASISLDLWSTKAAVDSKAFASRQAALAVEEGSRTTLISIQRAVYDSVSSAKSAAASAKALEYAERCYQDVQEQYRLSAASAGDLSDAALLASTGRASLIRARYAFLANLSSLRSLAGFETDDLLVQLIP
jgi:outer membrane protein